MRISDWSSDVCSSDLFGALDLFAPQVLKPESTRWRIALLAASRGQPMTSSPAAGAATLDVRAREPAGPALQVSGFRALGDQDRSEERPAGQEGVSTGRHRCARSN